MNNITELNELIYAGVKLACDEIGALLKNPIRNTKPGWEIRPERQVNREKYKQNKKIATIKKIDMEEKTCINVERKKKTKTVDKSNNTIWRDESKDIGKKREN